MDELRMPAKSLFSWYCPIKLLTGPLKSFELVPDEAEGKSIEVDEAAVLLVAVEAVAYACRVAGQPHNVAHRTQSHSRARTQRRL